MTPLPKFTRAAYVTDPGPPESIMVGALPVPPLDDDHVLPFRGAG